MDKIKKTKVASANPEKMEEDSELGNINNNHGSQESPPASDQNDVEGSTEHSNDKTGGATGDKKGCFLYQDWLVLSLGIVFIGIVLGSMFGLGSLREWDAPSGYSHNVSFNYERFLPEPCQCEYEPYPNIKSRISRSDAAGQWYYWKLKPDDVTIWNKVSIWILYAAHQISIWVVLYIAQCQKNISGGPRASNTLSRFNWISIGINSFFHILHLVHTHVLYDATAPDVAITSSQGSVIMLTLLVFVMEYNERGFIFGWPVAKQSKSKISKKLRLNMKPIYLIRKYHAYAFSWAAIYTFWYHPMENTLGHALGFLHTWFLMLQGSLMYTKVHINTWWRLLLESWVIIHSAVVAAQTRAGWPRFFFGFFFLFCLNQIYILRFWYKRHIAYRVIPPVVLIASVVGAYSQLPDETGKLWDRMIEIVFIPAVYYIGFILVWAFLYMCIIIDNKIYANRSREPTTTKKALYLIFSLIVYALFVVASVLQEFYALPLPLFVGMIVYTIIFCLGSALVCLFLSHTIPKFRISDKAAKALEDTAWNKQSVSADELPQKDKNDQQVVTDNILSTNM